MLISTRKWPTSTETGGRGAQGRGSALPTVQFCSRRRSNTVINNEKWRAMTWRRKCADMKSDPLMSDSPLTRRHARIKSVAVKRRSPFVTIKRGLLCSGVAEDSLETFSCAHPWPLNGKTKRMTLWVRDITHASDLKQHETSARWDRYYVPIQSLKDSVLNSHLYATVAIERTLNCVWVYTKYIFKKVKENKKTRNIIVP